MDIPQQSLNTFEVFKEFMTTHFPDVKIAGTNGREMIKRCHYCGDSRTTSSRHLYIGVNKRGVISYNCFKCNKGGTVNSTFFRDLGIFDSHMINMINESNKNAYRQSSASGGAMIERKTFHAAPRVTFTGDERTAKKLAYINRRLGTSLELPDLYRLKIIPNIMEYLAQSNIGYYSRAIEIMNELDFGFVGMLSVDNTHIVLRRLVPEDTVNPTIARRHTNYDIFPNYREGVVFYVIPGTIMRNHPCKIYIAEGCFDILSVYFNTTADHSNSIFAASCGKGNYVNLLKYIFITMTVSPFTAEVHIYADNDLSISEIEGLKQLLVYTNTTGYIHTNSYPGEKDFGVTADKIIDNVAPLYLGGFVNP